MESSITRRTALTALALTGGAVLTGCASSNEAAPGAAPGPTAADRLAEEVGRLEDRYRAQVGLRIRDTGSGAELSHRADQRFGFASTLKALAAAAMLRGTPPEERERLVTWSAADVEASGYSPVTGEHVGAGLSLLALGEAAVRQSDNTAMNLLLDYLGGPEGLRRELEGLGDEVTDVVHREPALNEIAPGSTADTSTAAALAASLERAATGDYLAEPDRELLIGWMSGNATGDTLVRAGAPEGWTVADKSGGAGALRNDLALAFPPGGGAPVVLCILTTRTDPAEEYDDALLAEAAAAAFAALEEAGASAS